MQSTEIISSSSTSFDHAVRDGLARANKTLENVTGAWIKAQEVIAKTLKAGTAMVSSRS